MKKMTPILLQGMTATKSVSLGCLLMLPATALLPLTFLVDLALAYARRTVLREKLSEKITHCPAGHEVGLLGAFACESCGGTIADTHAWYPSPCCGSMPSAITCPCGRSVTNPVPRFLR